MCEYCEMRDIEHGNVIWTEGETFKDPPHRSAVITREHNGFELEVTWNENGCEWASIPITHCPWCGRKLGGGAE